MEKVIARIQGVVKLTQIFGTWPSFHDAEVIELSVRRNGIGPKQGSEFSPVLTVMVHVWQTTPEVDAKGFFVLRNHTLATIRFHGVEEFKMEGFNHQNVIFGLDIGEEQGSQGASPLFTVNFDPSFGIDASFKCSRIEIVDAIPYTPESR
jgi:hypothetical protein